ncbi:MAG: fumarate reductase flavoprotein subunit, fumarate reductase flavoprotein subunit [Candidatus Peregrinibacteria bacterium GW2011_GWE2_39_6]|nr:MAG: fumarate reductase flavoprotein subunit, fumarate reductase flavoprotein subunit [Candidatus Peregrinibacteria bacterium GW2011_GWF2_39_17]KKR26610.1 MAG: fumarate reductase flavoprotein subunit, fumarate reductase flavoprotein subunit [Candidatus Peregrinibacteria bacterium GW2011_GWE2_39_6]HCW32487.1 hypothetical protein [Candidatus Peregrinibacteria bacterium]
METITQHDILIIGGGAAGLRAALAAVETNPKLSIALISKVYPIRSHTVSAEGGVAGVINPEDSLEAHAYDTIKGSNYLADQDAVELFVKKAPLEIIQIENWGCPWSRTKEGKIATRNFGGMSKPRTAYAADKTGFYLLHSLFERSLKYKQITRYDEWFVTKILTCENQATGIIAIQQRTGQIFAFSAKAIILATGGAGYLYQFTTNSNIKTGDGMALALQAGVALKDMEFIQFHPTGLARTGILITEAARSEGGYLLNKNNDRFLKNYAPKTMEMSPRDLVSQAIISEIKAGRGIETPYGQCVHLDLRHLGESLIKEKLPLVREVAKTYQGVDPVYDLIPVRPVAHYFMGGIDVDLKTATPLKGLFSAGETACLSIHGANRLGSNSLAECLVFGNIAGKTTAKFVDTQPQNPTLDQTQLKKESDRLAKLRSVSGPERVAPLKKDLGEMMEQAAGLIRDKKNLEIGLTKLTKLKQRYQKIGLSDHEEIFNTEFLAYLELSNLLDVAETILISALAREESRGAHFRTDFPKQNNRQFHHHHLITRAPDGLKISLKPVTITKWPLP